MKRQFCFILIINDFSDDDTKNIIKKFGKKVELIERPKKLGLGTAHILAMLYAIKNNYKFFNSSKLLNDVALPSFYLLGKLSLRQQHREIKTNVAQVFSPGGRELGGTTG